MLLLTEWDRENVWAFLRRGNIFPLPGVEPPVTKHSQIPMFILNPFHTLGPPSVMRIMKTSCRITERRSVSKGSDSLNHPDVVKRLRITYHSNTTNWNMSTGYSLQFQLLRWGATLERENLLTGFVTLQHDIGYRYYVASHAHGSMFTKYASKLLQRWHDRLLFLRYLVRISAVIFVTPAVRLHTRTLQCQVQSATTLIIQHSIAHHTRYIT